MIADEMVRSFILPLLLMVWAVPGCEQPPAPLTQDRNSLAGLDALVAGPLVLLQRGEVAASEAAFAVLLEQTRARAGMRSVRELDLLIAFGVALHSEQNVQRAQLYLKRAVDAARGAFGSRHPEVALALHTYGGALDERSDVAPPAAAVEAVEEALSIRRETLGPDNVETLATIEAVARLHVRTVRETGDRRAAAQAEALILEVMPSAEKDGRKHLAPPEMLRLELGEVYAATGRVSELMRMIDEDIRAQVLPETAGWGPMIDLFWHRMRDLFDGRKPGATLPTDCLLSLDILWSDVLTILEKRDPAAAQLVRNRGCKPPDVGAA